MSFARQVGTRVFLKVFNEHPGFAMVVYGIFLLATGFFLVRTVATVINYPNQPQVLTIQEAFSKTNGDDPLWVTITDANAKCSELLKTRDNHLLPLVSSTGDSLIVFKPPTRQFACDKTEHEFQGVMTDMHKKYYAYLSGLNFPILSSFEREQVRSLCGGCGPEDEKLGIYILTPFLLLFLWGTIHFGRLFLRS